LLEKSSTVQRHATDNQERGASTPVVCGSVFAMPPPGYSEHNRRFPGDRDCDEVRQPSGDGLLHACDIALGNAFPYTTAGSRPPLLCRATVCRRTCAWCPITHTSAGPTAGSRPPLLFAGANVCRCNGDFRDAQTHVQPRAGGVSPPWLGNTSGVLEKSSTIQRHATDNHLQQAYIRAIRERGA
jgi:hypothetical protein